MQKVVSILKTMSKQNDSSVDPNMIDPNAYTSVEENTSFEEAIDINKDLSIGGLVTNMITIIEENNSSSQNQVSTIVYENNLLKLSTYSNSSRDSFDSIFDNINNMIVDKLVTFVIKKHNEGITFNYIKQLIEQRILRLNHPSNNILNWLLKNQVKPQYTYFLGVFY